MSKFLKGLDVILLTVPLIKFEDVVYRLPADLFRGKLVVNLSPLNSHPKAVMLQAFENHQDVDLLCSHLMFGSAYTSGDSRGANSNCNSYPSSMLDGRHMVYEKVRISDVGRCERYLKIFEDARCHLVEMTVEQHDASIADAEFVTHLTGRLLHDTHMLPPTPVISREYAALCDMADMSSGDSFDVFFGMFKFNNNAQLHLTRMRENLAKLEQKLAAKEAYLAASSERQTRDRQSLITETKLLLQEIVRNGGLDQSPVNAKTEVD